MENELEQLEQQVEQLLEKDTIDNQKTTQHGALRKTGCSVVYCDEREEKVRLQQKVKLFERESFQMKREIEFYEDRLIEGLDEKQKEEAIQKALQSRDIQVHKKLILAKDELIKKIQAELNELRKEYQTYKKDQDRIMTNFEADGRIQEKVRRINALEDNYDLLLTKKKELEAYSEKATAQLNLIIEQHNRELDKYESMHIKLKQLELINRSGFRLEPIKPPLPPEKRKRRWRIPGFTARN